MLLPMCHMYINSKRCSLTKPNLQATNVGIRNRHFEMSNMECKRGTLELILHIKVSLQDLRSTTACVIKGLITFFIRFKNVFWYSN